METQLGYNLDNATRLFRVRKTCLEMLRDRGYAVAPVLIFLLAAAPRRLSVVTDERPAFHSHLVCVWQEDLDESRDAFISKFSEEPKRDDLTLLCFKDDDPSDQVPVLVHCTTPSWPSSPAPHC